MKPDTGGEPEQQSPQPRKRKRKRLWDNNKTNNKKRENWIMKMEKYCKGRVTWEEAKPIVDFMEHAEEQEHSPDLKATISRIKLHFEDKIYGRAINSRREELHVDHQTIERQIVIPPRGHYHERTGTVNNNFPSLPPAIRKNRQMIE